MIAASDIATAPSMGTLASRRPWRETVRRSDHRSPSAVGVAASIGRAIAAS